MEDKKLINIIEATIMASAKPISVDKILQILSENYISKNVSSEKLKQEGISPVDLPSKDKLLSLIDKITLFYKDRGIELKQLSSGFCFQVRNKYASWVSKLWEEKPQKYSRALLETLALIAYRQPITRGDIENIRGVGVSSQIIRTLSDREWIRIIGHRDVPGKPAMYATTKGFLDYFSLSKLSDLPPLSELMDIDKLDPELDLGFESVER